MEKIDYSNVSTFKETLKIKSLLGYPNIHKQMLEKACTEYNKKHKTNFVIKFEEFSYKDGYKNITEYNIEEIFNKSRKRALQLSLLF